MAKFLWSNMAQMLWKHKLLFHCFPVPMLLLGGTEVCTELDLTWAERAPDSPQVGPLWGPFGGPRGPPKGSNRSKSGELQPDLAKIGPKLAPAGPKDPSLCLLGAPRGPPRAPITLFDPPESRRKHPWGKKTRQKYREPRPRRGVGGRLFLL